MNIQVKLTGSRWYRIADDEGGCTIDVAGYAFQDKELLTEKGLASFLLSRLKACGTSQSIETVLETVQQLNGMFAIVYQHGTECMAIVDRVRSIPLFYRRTDGGFCVSDDARLLLGPEKSFHFHPEALLEFLLSGYVTGQETLHSEIFQVPAGKLFFTYKKEEDWVACSLAYFHYFDESCTNLDDHSLEESLYRTLENVFDRYSRLFHSKKILLPLSGGLDSRLVAAMLKKAGVTDVVCFSYGDRCSDDSQLSRQVARTLGYEWHFVPYPGRQLWIDLSKDRRFHDYVSSASAFSSLAHLQDWPAAQQLARDFPEDDVIFVPGHTGDFLSGGHLPAEIMAGAGSKDFSQLVAGSIWSHHYRMWPVPASYSELEEVLLGRIKSSLITSPNDLGTAAKCYEDWEWAGRQAKFIVNSVRVYDSFDKRWALPLWDNDLMDFFMRLAVPAKWHKRIYINTLLSRVFSRELSELKTIPVSSTTRLVYRAASAPAVKSSSSILKKSLLSFPYVNSIPVMVRNYVNDVFHMYGCFTESTSLTQLLKPAKSVLHVAPNGSASGLFRITEPHTGKPILMLSRGGLFGARYVLELMNSGNRATQ